MEGKKPCWKHKENGQTKYAQEEEKDIYLKDGLKIVKKYAHVELQQKYWAGVLSLAGAVLKAVIKSVGHFDWFKRIDFKL